MKHNANAVIYCRVSTEEQAEKGVSLEAQEQSLRQYCAMRGLAVAAVIVDAGVSAATPLAQREGGAELLTALRRRKDPIRHVVAMKLDRIFRDVVDCLSVVEGWNKAGVALHLIDMGGQTMDTGSAMGGLFLTMLAGIAAWERKVIGERTKAALAYKRSKGERTTGIAPVGHAFEERGIEDDKMKYNVVEDPTEQRAVARARELRDVEGLSIRKVAAQLDAEGFKPRGKAWHPTTVARLLKREDGRG